MSISEAASGRGEERPGPSTPAAELHSRIAGLQRAVQDLRLDAALILQNADLYYYAGTVQRSYLYVPAQGSPTLFVRRVVDRARHESALSDIVPLHSVRELADGIHARHGRLPARLGLELDVVPVAHLVRLQALLPGVEPVDVAPAIREQRAVKSAHEVQLVRAAAAITDAVCERLPELLHEGVTEAEFAGSFEAVARSLGHEGVIRMRGFNEEMFYGQLVSGENGTVPGALDTPLCGAGLSAAVGQGVTMRRIGRGEPVVFDFVSSRHGYIADFTRVFSLGPLSQQCRRAHAVAVQIEQEVAAAAVPGASCAALYDLALRRAREAGLQDGFMGPPGYRARFIGHGVGLELDELPVLTAVDRPLRAGNVFALEPKFVLPGVGAVGIEDTFLVTETGAQCLSATPARLFEL